MCVCMKMMGRECDAKPLYLGHASKAPIQGRRKRPVDALRCCCCCMFDASCRYSTPNTAELRYKRGLFADTAVRSVENLCWNAIAAKVRHEQGGGTMDAWRHGCVRV